MTWTSKNAFFFTVQFFLYSNLLTNFFHILLFSKKEHFEAFLSIMYGKQEAESVIIERHHSSLMLCSTSVSCENAVLLNQAGRGSRVEKSLTLPLNYLDSV